MEAGPVLRAGPRELGQCNLQQPSAAHDSGSGPDVVMPVTEFCEWSGEKGSKQEHWFSLPAAPIFTFAGI